MKVEEINKEIKNLELIDTSLCKQINLIEEQEAMLNKQLNELEKMKRKLSESREENGKKLELYMGVIKMLKDSK